MLRLARYQLRLLLNRSSNRVCLGDDDMTLPGHGHLGTGNGVQMLFVVPMTKEAMYIHLAKLSKCFGTTHSRDGLHLSDTSDGIHKSTFAPDYPQVELVGVIPDGP
ncbi:uncharacterized protein TrAtP1_002013 [Trichoderma atroviride]|uniref:uncharacterized protein n=1 Tax=Hypocrea atroviridis TaxID=63577 RepID=UPI00333364AA|nr:hypothetical protein TrAtP1_002013 [Trichoderma atroviride]